MVIGFSLTPPFHSQELCSLIRMGREEIGSELRLVLIGGRSKQRLFHKLCLEAKRWERHAAYQDIHYLVVDHEGREITIEVTDPGVGNTGGREMAIRNADIGILCYSPHDVVTFENIRTLPPIFELRKKPCPIRLIAGLDEMEGEATSSCESVSEGYESDVERSGSGLRRRESMEKMRERQDSEQISSSQGEELCSQLGEYCKFMVRSMSEWEDPMESIREMIVEVMERRKKGRSRRLFSITRDSKGSTRSNSTSSSIDGEKKEKGRVQSKVCSMQ
ncbi:hypothetical protein PMAYCL1PPCAC_02491 [Pristionchus mayeri]|uniref:Uncharacterized protein n=1 Tax=Pristionchus mayeri TaxID=1317129 RepID=A0AAN4Z1V8_9BILA|nr:hypothetical protein PMAYCL1PPCAC_02491 [Pristionchus mayeri]